MRTEKEIKSAIDNLRDEIKAIDKKIDSSSMGSITALEKQIEDKNKQITLLKWVLS